MINRTIVEFPQWFIVGIGLYPENDTKNESSNCSLLFFSVVNRNRYRFHPLFSAWDLRYCLHIVFVGVEKLSCGPRAALPYFVNQIIKSFSFLLLIFYFFHL